MPVSRRGIELGVLLGVANVVIFTHNLPPAIDVKAMPQHDPGVENSERMALMETTALTLLVAGFARSLETFIVGGMVVVAASFVYKHANAIHPDSNTTQPPGMTMGQDTSGGLHSLPTYGDSDGMESTG